MAEHAMTYRREIDGLRAIAVLAVVLYHFGLPGLAGGFVGVDIFFVISGFLIGGILWDELKRSQSVDLAAFFMRRIRRLAPAFFAMTTVTAVFAYFVLLPFEFREFGKSMIAATVWLSNVQFFREAGYFDIGADNKVLLHTWSLAVEEQFYVVLPLALLLLRRSGKTAILALVATWAASLIACVVFTPVASTATFFLFPFRAWELLSGVLLAIWGRESGSKWRSGPIPSWVGVLLLLGALTLIRPGTQFPGWQALVPVAGTVLILLNGQDKNPVNAALSSKVPVFIGLISYSLYLWHWPVLTLSTYWRGTYASGLEAAAWLLLAVTLSIGAWAWIERPIRRSVPNFTLITGFVTFFILSVGAGLWAYQTNGAEDRFSPAARVHIEASNGFFTDGHHCSIATEGSLQGLDVCTVGPPGPPQVLFWGDSHLRAMMSSIDGAAIEGNTPGLIVWRPGCPPLFGVTKEESSATPAEDQKCLANTERMHKAVANLKSIRRIVLVGRWTYYANGKGTGLDDHNRIVLSPAPGSPLQGQPPSALYASAWKHTVEELQPHFEEIFVLRQVPEMPSYGAREIARRIAHDRTDPDQIKAALTVSSDVLQARVAPAEAPLTALAREGRITLIDTWPRFCTPECEVIHNGKSLYFDNNHLSNTGALALRELLMPAVTGRKSP